MRNLGIIILSFFIFSGFALQLFAQEWEYPVIKGYGSVNPLPHAAVQPDKNLQYKIIFDIGSDKLDADNNVNFQLSHVARLINVFASAGMMPDQMKLVAVVHSAATPIVLNNGMFKSKMNMDNPNLKLISELKDAGVKLYVCGQSLADFDYQQDWVNPDFTVALSSQVVIPTYELKGYAYMP